MIKVEPHIITIDDDGIRPAGEPDECFYCRNKIGEKHAYDCVMVTIENTYKIFLDKVFVGTWTTKDPASWDYDMCYFHKNEGTWCANNLRSQGELNLKDNVVLPLDQEEADICTICSRIQLVPEKNND